MMGKYDKKKVLLSGLIACMTGLIYWCIALNSTEKSLFGVANLGNIKCYILFVFITCFMFLVSYLLLKPINMESFIPDKWKRSIPFCEAVMVVLITYPVISKAWKFPVGITIVVQVTLLIVIYLQIRDSADSNSNMISIILVLVFGLLAGLKVATPNTFAKTVSGVGFNVHHTSAYIDSIYNVMRGIEFKGNLTSQYGHYALFFFIPLKIFGCSTKNIAIIMGIIGAATYILSLSSFCMVVKNKVIRIFTIIVCTFYVMHWQLNIYWQCDPHRLIFPAITLFLIAYFSDRKLTIGKFIISIITMTAAMIWNTESGIVCCLAVGVWWFMRYLQECTLSYKKLGFSIIIMVSIPVLAVIFATGVVDFYNILCATGTELDITSFAGRAVDTGYIERLETTLKWGNDIYLHKMFVFLICLCWGTANSILNKNIDKKNYIKSNYTVVVSILGLGLLTYYINRTLAGHGMVHCFFVLCLGLIISGSVDIIKSRISIKQLAVYDITKLVLGAYAILMMNNVILSNADIYNILYTRYNSLAYDYESFKSFCEEIAETVPQDTWGAGEGTSAIYMQLGWDKKTQNFNSLNTQEMNNQSEIFVYSGYYDEAQNNFYLAKEFEYNGRKFGYFTKINYVSGRDSDGWADKNCEIMVYTQDANKIELSCYALNQQNLRVLINGEKEYNIVLEEGMNSFYIDCEPESACSIIIESDYIGPLAGSDERERSYVLSEVKLLEN